MPDNIRRILPQLIQNPNTASLGNALAAKYINPEQWQTFRDTQGNLFQVNRSTGERKIIDKSTLLTPQEFAQKQDLADRSATKIMNNIASGERSYDSKVGGDYGQTFVDINKSARDSVGALNNLNLMDKLIDNPDFYSGTGGQTATALKKAAASLGIKDADSAAPNELFTKLSQKSVLDASGGSLGTGFSNADRDYLNGTVANISNTPAGNRRIIGIARVVEQRKQDVAKLARDYVKTHGGRLDAGF